MGLIFTKTCLRDAERVAYQIDAVQRLFPACGHLVLTDGDGYGAQPRWPQWPQPRQRYEPRSTGSGYLHVVATETVIPGAAEVRNPYMRQQVIKVAAPIIWGDMIQIDSDMCPFTHEDEALDILQTWYFQEPRSQARREALEGWARAYSAIFGEDPGPIGKLDFMGPNKGWRIPRALAAKFTALAPAVWWEAAGRHPVSEYQLLGIFAQLHSDVGVTFREGEQPRWCHHFTSSEPLTAVQREQLREAGDPHALARRLRRLWDDNELVAIEYIERLLPFTHRDNVVALLDSMPEDVRAQAIEWVHGLAAAEPGAIRSLRGPEPTAEESARLVKRMRVLAQVVLKARWSVDG